MQDFLLLDHLHGESFNSATQKASVLFKHKKKPLLELKVSTMIL